MINNRYTPKEEQKPTSFHEKFCQRHDGRRVVGCERYNTPICPMTCEYAEAILDNLEGDHKNGRDLQ